MGRPASSTSRRPTSSQMCRATSALAHSTTSMTSASSTPARGRTRSRRRHHDHRRAAEQHGIVSLVATETAGSRVRLDRSCDARPRPDLQSQLRSRWDDGGGTHVRALRRPGSGVRVHEHRHARGGRRPGVPRRRRVRRHRRRAVDRHPVGADPGPTLDDGHPGPSGEHRRRVAGRNRDPGPRLPAGSALRCETRGDLERQLRPGGCDQQRPHHCRVRSRRDLACVYTHRASSPRGRSSRAISSATPSKTSRTDVSSTPASADSPDRRLRPSDQLTGAPRASSVAFINASTRTESARAWCAASR